MVTKIVAVREDTERAIRRIGRRSRRRRAAAQARELFAQLGHAIQREPEQAQRPRLARLHLRHSRG